MKEKNQCLIFGYKFWLCFVMREQLPNLELQEKLTQLDDQLLSYQENNLSNRSNNDNLNLNRDISTQNKITELTRRSRMYYRGSMELKDKLNFQREEYENIRKVLQGELDNLRRFTCS